jgi:hypothetical protein
LLNESIISCSKYLFSSNYDKFVENEKKFKKDDSKIKKSVEKQKNLPAKNKFDLINSKTPKEDFFKKTERINPSEERLNEIELRPYFEGLVDKKELNYDTFTEPTNITKRLTKFRLSKKEMIKRATRVKRVKIIRDHVKRQLDDKTL